MSTTVDPRAMIWAYHWLAGCRDSIVAVAVSYQEKQSAMSTTFAKQFKAETVTRMAENIEHIAQAVSQLELDPPALGLHLRTSAFYLRKALEVWPVDEIG